MNLYNELVNGRGYSVFSIKNIHILKNLRNEFVERIYNDNKINKDISDARRMLAKMSKAEINKSMISLLSFANLSDMMIGACSDIVEELCGKDLFIQRRAHTVINVPGQGQAKQWTHYELMSGISPFTYVIWVPLHDLDDNGGVYYMDLETSSKIMKEEELSGVVNGKRVLNLIKNQKPTKLKFGEGIVFNPFVLHGNISFESEFARVACNVRFQSSNKPLLQKDSDYLKFFKLT
jgi:sporadic carbohydrate cluster 2OG-Fe(II) oxygenase|tara:strand:- start:107 stop:811 length:705 start_codon:yes stop_codon:yes gene_type:complete